MKKKFRIDKVSIRPMIELESRASIEHKRQRIATEIGCDVADVRFTITEKTDYDT